MKVVEQASKSSTCCAMVSSYCCRSLAYRSICGRHVSKKVVKPATNSSSMSSAISCGSVHMRHNSRTADPRASVIRVRVSSCTCDRRSPSLNPYLLRFKGWFLSLRGSVSQTHSAPSRPPGVQFCTSKYGSAQVSRDSQCRKSSQIPAQTYLLCSLLFGGLHIAR